AFGWDAYKKVFKEYRDLPRNERPRTEQEKHDQWMVRFSKATGRNLGPFFQAWGVPTSEQARKSIEGLPAWMPEGK
ncbi:MAG: M60 family metallopeptidase, partial [Tepidisphaeraceae bacterium]